MTQMSIAEQHRIVQCLVDKYQFRTNNIYDYAKAFHRGLIRITTEDRYSSVNYGTYFRMVILIASQHEPFQFNKSIQELQETCFQDLLNPTENELTLFELIYGFKWPLMEDKNEIS